MVQCMRCKHFNKDRRHQLKGSCLDDPFGSRYTGNRDGDCSLFERNTILNRLVKWVRGHFLRA